MDSGVAEPPGRRRTPRPREPFVNLIKVLIGSNSEPRDACVREPIPPIILCGCRQRRAGRRHAHPSDLHRTLEPAAAIESEPSMLDAARISPEEGDPLTFNSRSVARLRPSRYHPGSRTERDRPHLHRIDGKQPDEERSQLVEPEATAPNGDDTLAALGMPLNADTIDTDSEDVGADTVIAARCRYGVGRHCGQ